MAPSAEGPPGDSASGANLREMEAYMMADLGRGRQEELPLDERSRSVYNPDRRRGQITVSKALKGRLASGWGSKCNGALQNLNANECRSYPRRRSRANGGSYRRGRSVASRPRPRCSEHHQG